MALYFAKADTDPNLLKANAKTAFNCFSKLADRRPNPSMSKSFSLVVSIINFRTGDLTLSCVQSILDVLGSIDAQIVVVDNRSDDGSAEQIERWIETQDPPVPVTLLRSLENSGFSGGHNQSLTLFDGEYYLILNSDAVLRPGFFDALLAAASEHPETGIFAPRIEDEDGHTHVSCFRFPNPASELIRGAASGPVTRLLSRYHVPLEMPRDSSDIEWASFACILLRSSVLDNVGPMDEGYFLYFEDAEYCWRAQKANFRIRYVPNARVVHFRGGSGPVKSLQRENKRLPAYYYASRTRFFFQAYGRGGLILANALWLLGRGLAQSRRVFGRTVPEANLHETRDIWTNFLSPLGDRRAPKKG